MCLIPELLMIGLPSGGGLGDPRERDPELVREDVLDCLVIGGASPRHLRRGLHRRRRRGRGGDRQIATLTRD